MSELTIPDLLALVPEEVHQLPGGWAAVAGRLADAAQEHSRASRRLPDAWTAGPAASAAGGALSALGDDLGAAETGVRQISLALDAYAHGMTALRRRAMQVIAEAEDNGYVVDRATGRITPPDAATHPRQGPLMSARTLLQSLAEITTQARTLDDATAARLAANTPGADGTLPRRLPAALVDRSVVAGQRGRDPAAVRAWWSGLSPEQRGYAIAAYPELVGWLDGVPALDRDQANRISLAQERAAMAARLAELRARLELVHAAERDGTLHSLYPSAYDTTWASGRELAALQGEITGLEPKLATLDRVYGRINEAAEPPVLLLGLDTTGDGRLLVSVGNPDTAAHTAVFVPGVGTSLTSGMLGNIDRSARLQEAATPAGGGPGGVAVVAWLGYDAPEVDQTAAGSHRAEVGGAALDRFVSGLRATHDGPTAHLTAVGHSYGSTVIGQATQVGHLAVDDIVTAGSPGMDVTNARDLHIDPRHVYAGAAADDKVTVVGGLAHLVPPSEPQFGGNVYRVDTSGHSGYWSQGSDSLRNQAAVIAGDYDHVKLTAKARP